MKLQQAINHIVYASNPKVAPKGVSQVRWNAIRKHIQNNWKKIQKNLPE